MRRRGTARLAWLAFAASLALAGAAQGCNPFPPLDELSAGRGPADGALDGEPSGDAAPFDATLDGGDAGPPRDAASDVARDARLADAEGGACPAPFQLVAACHPTALVVAGGNLFWTSAGNGSATGIFVRSTQGTASGTPLGTYGSYLPTGLVTDGRDVLWVQADVLFGVGADGGRPSTPSCVLGGVPGTQSKAAQPVAAAGYSDDAFVLATLSATQYEYFTFKGQHLRAVSREPAADAACPADTPFGGALPGNPQSGSMAQLDGTVYFGSGADLVASSSASSQVPSQTEPSLRNLVADDAAVYWTNGGTGADSGAVRRLVPGMAPASLATGRGAPYAVAVDDTDVYWSEADGRIWRVAKLGQAPADPELVGCTGTDPVIALALDATHVFFITDPLGVDPAVDAGTCSLPGTEGAIWSLPK